MGNLVDWLPFKRSEGKQYILVLLVVSGLVQAGAVSRATGENTVEKLKLCFSFLPKPKSIQSDNRSHFTARVVQTWVKSEGIQWTFHTPYYPQANGIVERTNSLLKHFLKPHEPGWFMRLSEAVTKVNDGWGVNGCPWITVFCPKPPSLLAEARETEDVKVPLHHSGQYVLVELPSGSPLGIKNPFQQIYLGSHSCPWQGT